MTEQEELREMNASKAVKRYMWWSMGSGLIPVPLLDVTLLSGVQLRMLGVLSKHYDVPFLKNVGKSLIATLVSFVTANSLRGTILTSFMKVVPGVGLLGYASMPILCGAITYAIGKIFIQHFESGGTMLTFKPYKVKEHFEKLYKEGRQAAVELKAEKGK